MFTAIAVPQPAIARASIWILGTLLQGVLCQLCVAQPLQWELTGRDGLKSTNTCKAMTFAGPGAIAVNARGDLYIAGEKGSAALQVLRADGTRSILLDRRKKSVRSGHYTGISLALDSAGSVYLAFRDRGTIEKLDPKGAPALVAGSPGDLRSVDGRAPVGRFKALHGIAVSKGGELYAIDNKAVRKVGLDGRVSTLAGDLKGAYPELVGPILNMRDGVGATARFVHPSAIAISPKDEIYVADGYYGEKEGQTASVGFIRKVSKEGAVALFAGRYFGDIDGKGSEAGFGYMSAMAFDDSGNVYLSEPYDDSVRKVDSRAKATTLLSSMPGGGDPPFPWEPIGITASANGVVYVVNTVSQTAHADEGHLYRIKEAGTAEVLCTPSTF